MDREATAQTRSPAQRVVYAEDFNDGQGQGWELERGWSVQQHALAGRGHHWARYPAGFWENMRLSFRLKVWNQGMHANVRVSDTGRYAVGFRVEDDVLHVYLFKELWHIQPSVFRQLAQRRTGVEPKQQGLRAEIAVEDGTIMVRINTKLVLKTHDPNPLPAGSIAFETLDEGTALIDDIVVRAERQLIEVPEVTDEPVVTTPPQPAYVPWVDIGLVLLILLAAGSIVLRRDTLPRPAVLRIVSTQDMGHQEIAPTSPPQPTFDIRLYGHLDAGEQTLSVDRLTIEGNASHGS
jgi:hypothetical protein